MGYVDEAFHKLKGYNEITDTEARRAASRHARIRERIEQEWDVDRDFLTGSYGRDTKIKPLRDVDIFVVVDQDGEQADYRSRASSEMVNALADVLDGHFPAVHVELPAVVVAFNDDDASFEVTPAFDHDTVGFEIPATSGAGWMRTDPDEHGRLTTQKNAACDARWVPLAKMLKSWNETVGRPIEPSFLVEVMALRLVQPFDRYQDGVIEFLGNTIDHIDGPWPDPAHVGPDVDADLGPMQRREIARLAEEALAIGDEASYLEERGRQRAAVDKWRELFGNRMPKP